MFGVSSSRLAARKRVGAAAAAALMIASSLGALATPALGQESAETDEVAIAASRAGRQALLRPASFTLELDERPLERPEVSISDVSLADLLPDSELFHPDVMRHVRLDLGSAAPVAIEIATSQLEYEEATSRRVQAFSLRNDLIQEQSGQSLVVERQEQALAEAEEALLVSESEIGDFALGTFLGFEELEVASLRLETNVSPIPELTDAAEDVLTDRLFADRSVVSSRRAALAQSRDRLDRLANDLAETQRRLTESIADQQAAYARVIDNRPRLEDSLVQRPVAGTDLTGVVLNAYYNAQILMSERRPACDVTWDQLAGIGLIETRHGTFGGNVVGSDGVTSGRILGPELNGDPFAAISDTDGGALDGNPVWDHAVGPMQFIPGSWKLYALDGDGDGTADPHNIYDAAMSAAEHLCRSTGGLQNEGNFTIALFGYNRSEQYGIEVKAARSRYAASVDL